MDVRELREYGKTVKTEEDLRREIESAEAEDLRIITFPKELEQAVREILAETWGHVGYHYAMNMSRDKLAIVSFIVKGEDEASG